MYFLFFFGPLFFQAVDVMLEVKAIIASVTSVGDGLGTAEMAA